jgi:hypothetical protein
MSVAVKHTIFILYAYYLCAVVNDNSLYILTQIVWQYVTAFDAGDHSLSSRPFAGLSESGAEGEELVRTIRHILPFSRTLFLFNIVCDAGLFCDFDSLMRSNYAVESTSPQ